jgi:curved DNA-binding protein
MADDKSVDYYEALQVSTNAELDTIHRVYRLLAQRFHPDNRETGNETRFRAISDAYSVLSDPEQRARYDIVYQQHRRERWRLVSNGQKAENDFEIEQIMRLTVLEALYTKRRTDPTDPGIFASELEELTGRPREHLEFTLWYLVQRKLVLRGDSSQLVLTADGADYLEQNYRSNVQRRRLAATTEQSRQQAASVAR